MRRMSLSLLTLAAKAGLTLFGLLLVTFLIARVVPIDPVLAVVGDRASPETYARVRAEMGLDRPVAVQFGRYAGALARGDLGRSALTREPVTDDIAPLLPGDVRARDGGDPDRPGARRAGGRRGGGARIIAGPIMRCASSRSSAIRCRCSGSD